MKRLQMKFKRRDDLVTIPAVIQRNTGLIGDAFFGTETEPYIHNLDAAVRLLLENKDKVIHVVGDYDVDGICGTACAALGLKRAGFKYTTRLPKRFSEGYGLSVKIINEIQEGVILTVDNGIAANEAISVAKEKGLTVIVTDHHLAPMDKEGNILFPDADVVIDPSVDEQSEFHKYCGAAVAYRLAEALNPGIDLKDLMVLASIATVADVMDLTGANHRLVKEGLKAINSGIGTPGIRMLIEKLELGNHITEDDFGFKLGPIFNASSRLYDEGAEKALAVVMASESEEKLPWMVDELIENNEKRKSIQEQQTKTADNKLTNVRPIVVYDESFGDGIIGLIAGHYCEKYQCPVIVFTKAESGDLKGSGRSIPEIDLKAVLDKIQDKILHYGGHAGAAGLTIAFNRLQEFTDAFIDACGPMPESKDYIEYDLKVDVKDVKKAVEILKKYAPFGQGNPKIEFLVQNVNISDYREIMNRRSFIADGNGLKLLGFDMADKFADLVYPKRIDAVGSLSESWYKDVGEYKLEVLDFEASH